MIPQSQPTILGEERKYIEELVSNPDYFKNRHFLSKCVDLIAKKYVTSGLNLTNSCTQALELAAILLNIQPGDEVILPSFTYISTANAFVMRGAVPVFVDIEPDTMNINPTWVGEAISGKTKAIVPVHYAGVGCAMNKIMAISKEFNIPVIEDAAHCYLAEYDGKMLGSLGDFGCLSFDYVKNLNCGEGGMLIVNREKYLEDLEMIYENGTNRAAFKRGEVEKFIWKNVGSNFYPSDLTAAFLYPQLKAAQDITQERLGYWELYLELLEPLQKKGVIEIPQIPGTCKHNAHIFWIKTKDQQERTDLIKFLSGKEIQTAFHYIPLHSTKFGRKVSRFHGDDKFTTTESERLLRLPLYYKIGKENINKVAEEIYRFYKS